MYLYVRPKLVATYNNICIIYIESCDRVLLLIQCIIRLREGEIKIKILSVQEGAESSQQFWKRFPCSYIASCSDIRRVPHHSSSLYTICACSTLTAPRAAQTCTERYEEASTKSIWIHRRSVRLKRITRLVFAMHERNACQP